jgi:hypothetical protein
LTITFPKARVEGVIAAVCVLLAPVPDKLDVNTPAPVLTVSVPLRAVESVGKNFTTTAQLAPAASELAQVLETKLKSVPLTEADVGTVTLNEEAPLLAAVAVSVLGVLTTTVPNDRLGVITAVCVLPLPLIALA